MQGNVVYYGGRVGVVNADVMRAIRVSMRAAMRAASH
jgi:hypothetical protein